jgi:hypothetical protein
MCEITTEDESVLLGNYDPKAPRGIVKEAIKKRVPIKKIQKRVDQVKLLKPV